MQSTGRGTCRNEGNDALHAVNPTSDALIADPNVIDPFADPGALLDQTRYSSPEELKIWDDLTAGMRDADKQKFKAVWNRPLAAAADAVRELGSVGHEYRGGGFSDRTDLPPEAQAVPEFGKIDA